MNRLVSASLEWIGKLAEARDDGTGKHIERVQEYLKILIKNANEHKLDVDSIILASVLHDIGKIKIPDSILLKKSRLTAVEFEKWKSIASMVKT